MKIDEKIFQTASGRKIEINLFASNFHVELNPSEAGIYDRIVIQEIIKDFSQTQQLGKSKHTFKGIISECYNPMIQFSCCNFGS